MKTIEIAGRKIGPNQPVFIVVETGTTCNGSVDTAKQMIDAAKEAGADAVKFQMIRPDQFMSDKEVKYEYEWSGGKRSENMYEMFKGLEFSPAEWKEIQEQCARREIIFYATIDNLPDVEVAQALGMPAYKVSSWDVANLSLVRRMAQTGMPIELDLGPAYLTDIDKLIQVIRSEGNDNILLLHCSHAKTPEGINLRSVPYLQTVFDLPTGYSADGRDSTPDVAAVVLGAHVLEKRLTLDKDFPGHHHILALEPDEFRAWVELIRRTEAMLGKFAVVPSEEDLRQRPLYFTSLVAATDIPAGTVVTQDKLAIKRPGTGIPEEMVEVVAGRPARRDIQANQVLTWDDI